MGAALLGPTRSFKVESSDLRVATGIYYTRDDITRTYIKGVRIELPDTCTDPQLRTVRREKLKEALLKLHKCSGDQIPPRHVRYMNRDDLAATLDALSDGSEYSYLITEGQIRLGPFSPVNDPSRRQDRNSTHRLDVDRLLSAPTELAINGVTVALDSVERAEWSLCESDAERDDYPMWMLEQRAARAASNAQNPVRDDHIGAGSEPREGEGGQEGAEVRALETGGR